MPCEITKPASTLRECLMVTVTQPRCQGGGDPAAQPHQDGCSTGQRAGPGQRGDGLAGAAEGGGQPAGYEEALHRRRRHTQGLKALGRRSGRGQVGERGGAAR
jgi:hypothetical protein